ncbi:MAG: DUF4192 domain-containing protein [Actinomycetota bacterium]|nr:DUF4192 domain-containing protein [Actinomycetota bacterium]
MSTTSRPEYPLDRPDVLIAALPAVLGFVPERSLVLVTAAHGQLGAVLRIDLPGEDLEELRRLAETAGCARPDIAIAVIVDADGASCRLCAEEYRDMTRLLADELLAHGMELIAAHVVDVVGAGGRWYCADGCGNSGRVEDPMASPMTLAAVLDGRRLYARRADLLEVIAPVEPDRAAALARLLDHAENVDPAGADAQARGGIEHALRCAALVEAGAALDDEDLVRLGLALTDPQVRDTLYALAVGDRASQAESLWVDLARRLPAPWRAEALALLAFSAYVRCDGPLAGIALDAAQRCDPGHRMATMLDRALQSGIRPEEIRELARTGYRLAARLGVPLPPRRLFGRTG